MGHRFNAYLSHYIQKRRQTQTSGLYNRQVSQIISYSYENLLNPAIRISSSIKDPLKKNNKLPHLTGPCSSGNLVLDNLSRHAYTRSRSPDRAKVSVGKLDPKKANSEQSEDAKQCTPMWGRQATGKSQF